MLTFPNIDPVALEIGPVAIRWYSLAYVGGILLGWLYIRWLNRRQPITNLTPHALDDLILWSVLGVVLGGRLGYVIFYKPLYFMEHPLKIVQMWEGGMSFHGGLAGVLIAMFIFCRKYAIPYLTLMDVVAAATPIGLFLGRIANFINGELYGRVTDSWVGMVFPRGGEFPRHPSQLYEATLEGLMLFIVLFCLVRFTKIRQQPGMVAGIFLAGYGISRAIVEYFREPDAHLGFIFAHITMGQILSFPMIALGIWLALRARTHKIGSQSQLEEPRAAS